MISQLSWEVDLGALRFLTSLRILRWPCASVASKTIRIDASVFGSPVISWLVYTEDRHSDAHLKVHSDCADKMQNERTDER